MTGPNEPEPELGEIEWLDGDPDDPDGPNGPDGPGHQPSRIPRVAWYALVVVVLAAVVIAVTVSQSHPKHRAVATPTPSSTPPTPSITIHLDPPTPTPSVTVRNLGHPLLDVSRGVDLFARDGAIMLRLELATGRITRTSGVELNSTAPASMVATRHGLLLMSYDPGSGLLIPDGKRPQSLPDRLAQGGGSVAPGPDLDHVWLMRNVGNAQAVLVGLDGHPTGPTLPASGDPDDTGYLVVPLTGGVYLARPGSLRRITTGALIAVGPTRWLTDECDDQHRCTLNVIDRATGEHHVLGPTGDHPYDRGQISPDGSTAAVARYSDSSDGSTTLHLVDLATGADRTVVRLGQNPDNGTPALLWTPDSRWLITIGQGGRIVAIDRAGHVRVLTGAGTSVSQLALRVQ
jgi:hypothetical protein